MNSILFSYFHNFANQTSFLDFLIIFLGVYLPYLVVLGAGIYLLIHHHIIPNESPVAEFRRKWREILVAFFSAGMGWLVAEVIKNIISSPRPYELINGVQNLFPETGFAFPSQHATFFTALAFSIYLNHKKAGYFFLFFAFSISIARIAGGVHYPVDILGGIIVGIIVSYIVHHLQFAKAGKNV